MNKLQILHLCGFFFFLLPLTSIFGSLNSGLVAWYPLDGNASDSSSADNHGTLQGATPCDDRNGQPGKALLFDGIDDQIVAPYQSSISSSSFSYSLWAKPTSSTSTYGGVITFRETFKGYNLYKHQDDRWSFWVGNGISPWQTIQGQAIGLSWTALAFTCDGSNLKAFQDGALIGSKTINPSFVLNTSNPLIIGSGNNSEFFFKGAIDEVRIYNRVLSTSEVSDLYDLEWNLPPHTLSISQTQFNENIPVGSTIANFSATDPDQDDLTYSLFSFSPLNLNPVLWLDADDPNTITTSSDKISGWNDKSGGNHIFSQSNHQRRPVLRQNKINGKPAVRFDGSDDFLSLNSRMGLSANPALTISAVLINQANTISDQRVFQLGGNAQNIIALAAGTNGWTWRFNGGNKNFGNTTNQQPQVVSWVRASGANFQQSSFFVNGLEIDALGGAGSGSPTNTTSMATIGSGSASYSSIPDLPFNGFLGEFIILNSSSGNDRGSIENYLSYKWGLGGNSPSTAQGFLLESNGTLKTSTSFDFENNQSSYQIWVRASDTYNRTVEGNFTISLVDLFEDLDGDGTEDHLDSDDDGDGFSDSVEIAYGSDPRDPNSWLTLLPTLLS